MPEIFVGVGSNTEPEIHLARGIALLRERFSELELSPVYRNAAVGFSGQDFYNLVLAFASDAGPLQLAEELRLIEDRCGRDRSLPRMGPRTLDLDLLLYGDAQIRLPGLELPRHEILQRSYILKPMADLRPQFLYPGTVTSFAELWHRFDRSGHPLHKVAIAL